MERGTGMYKWDRGEREETLEIRMLRSREEGSTKEGWGIEEGGGRTVYGGFPKNKSG